MKAQEIMTRDPACCTPDTTAGDAAKLMEQHDCGCIPVVKDQESKTVVGVVTDRDIALRGIGRGRGSDTPVRELMSEDPACCSGDTDLTEVSRLMAERQVRRVPIVDVDGCCVGMVAQADIARASDRSISDRDVGRVVEKISEPSRKQN